MAMGEWLTGDRVSPVTIYEKLQLRLRLLGPQGLAGMAAGGLDMAAWDAMARAAGLSLVRLLGAEPLPITAYSSLRAVSPAQAAEEAGVAVAAGFGAVKLKIGHGGLKADLEAIRAVRQAVGTDTLIMVDYNQCLTVAEALYRVRALDNEGLHWIEEPVRAHDFEGHAAVAREARTAIQTGESWWGPGDAAKSLAARGCDHAMLNAMKIGGVSGWLRAAALAEAAGVPVSSHIFPEFRRICSESARPVTCLNSSIWPHRCLLSRSGWTPAVCWSGKRRAPAWIGTKRRYRDLGCLDLRILRGLGFLARGHPAVKNPALVLRLTPTGLCGCPDRATRRRSVAPGRR